MFENLLTLIYNRTNDNQIVNAIKYNIEGGKLSRLKLFEQISGLTTDSSHIGSCIELLQALYLIADDIMDSAELRRNKVCWYKKKGISAIRDVNKMLALVFMTIPRNVIGVFKRVHFATCMGQNMDYLCAGRENCYTKQVYRKICAYKNGYYTFYLPISTGLIVRGIDVPESLDKICEIAGLLHQSNDDFIDFIPFVSGKTGNDISEKKITHFSIQIFNKHDDEMVREFFEGNGKKLRGEILRLIKKYPFDVIEMKKELLALSGKDTDWIVNLILRSLKLERENEDLNKN